MLYSAVMQDKRPLIITGLVLLLILVLIGAVIFYLVNFIRSRQTPEATSDLFPKSSASVSFSPTPSVSGLVYASTAPSASPTVSNNNPNANNPNLKTYIGAGFQVSYPKNWGLLTCSNSKSFEFDPYNSNDQIGVVCSQATKPITVQVRNSGCAGGESISLGNLQIQRSKDPNFNTAVGNGIQYMWCTKTNPTLVITHRVGNGTAYSTNDFSTQVEQMISNIYFPTAF